ncbi:HAMP domain-containing sensor histidine kinase [Solibacillus sp. CAU 1738]|uniref:sensor histidine kinase n=1 Tax=Solibacillus sp. CAU 1738 TaxID=3140363 RepID=UPI003260E0E5
MKNSKTILTLFLIFWTVFAGLTFLNQGSSILGKSYFTSDEFSNQREEFYEGLSRYVLTNFDAEKAKETIQVTNEEIDYYKNYYGTLEDQVQNIVWQYEGRLDDKTLDEDVRALLKEERDRKIAAVKKNFTDDEHVAEKIRTVKEQMIDGYAKEFERDKKQFLSTYNYFAFEFKNIETGEIITAKDVNEAALFTQKFTEGSYFRSTPEFYIDADSRYIDDGGSILNREMYISLDEQRYTGIVTVPKSMLKNAEFKQNYEAFTLSKIIHYIVWGTGIITLILLLTVMKPEREQFENLFPQARPYFNKLPIDIVLGVWLFAFMLLIAMLNGLGSTIYSFAYFRFDHYNLFNLLELAVLFVLTAVLLAALITSTVWMLSDIRDIEKWKKSVSLRIGEAVEEVFLNRSIGVQTLAMLIVFFLAGVGFTGVLIAPELLLVYIPLFIFVLMPTLYVFLRRMGYLNRVMKQTKDMAEGRLTSDVVVKGKSPIADHAKNLNELREGVRKSMSEQAKSERLKTELITNVSHDLRTPLTSIITYTDLLKNPDLEEEERLKYIDILDKKSARLKTLIEDLFDVSKMASGNVELMKQRVDLAQLLQQAVGEHGEDFAAQNLDLRVNIENQPIFAYVDGQKWWRVIDNIIVNARKYSLPNTRVYVTLKQTGTEAEFTVKNIAKYELTENVDELTERFKRADTSRHTDGSGLGLAIAQSIVDLHGARMKIEVDGDLFKVVVTVQAAF